MKPFDLEAAKCGEPICTRGGVERFFIGTNKRGEIFVEDISGKHYVMFKDGMTHTGKPNTLDLFMAPKKRTVWVNLYPDNHNSHWRTEEAANIAAGTKRIGSKAYPVEIEE